MLLSPIVLTFGFKLIHGRPGRNKSKVMNTILYMFNIVKKVIGFAVIRVVSFVVSYFAKYIVTLAIVLPWEIVVKKDFTNDTIFALVFLAWNIFLSGVSLCCYTVQGFYFVIMRTIKSLKDDKHPFNAIFLLVFGICLKDRDKKGLNGLLIIIRTPIMFAWNIVAHLVRMFVGMPEPQLLSSYGQKTDGQKVDVDKRNIIRSGFVLGAAILGFLMRGNRDENGSLMFEPLAEWMLFCSVNVNFKLNCNIGLFFCFSDSHSNCWTILVFDFAHVYQEWVLDVSFLVICMFAYCKSHFCRFKNTLSQPKTDRPKWLKCGTTLLNKEINQKVEKTFV